MISIYRKNLQNKLSKKGWLARNLAILFQSGNIPNFRCAFSTNIRLGEDVLKKSWRSLQDVISVIASHLANTSWRRLADVLGRRIANTSWRRLQDVFKTSGKTKKCYAEDVFKTSWRRLGKQEMFAGLVVLFLYVIIRCYFVYFESFF